MEHHQSNQCKYCDTSITVNRLLSYLSYVNQSTSMQLKMNIIKVWKYDKLLQHTVWKASCVTWYWISYCISNWTALELCNASRCLRFIYLSACLWFQFLHRWHPVLCVDNICHFRATMHFVQPHWHKNNSCIQWFYIRCIFYYPWQALSTGIGNILSCLDALWTMFQRRPSTYCYLWLKYSLMLRWVKWCNPALHNWDG